jgi:hypothetical protein
LSNILSAHKHVVLDVLAWIPYGIVHYVSPIVVSGCMFIWGPPGTLPIWARAFGYMNMTAVIIQLIFPCSPPWYENTYGLAPANYSIVGDAAGLKAIDKLFDVDLYTSGFQASPMVFGAFPSLHSGWATLETLFMGHVFPQLFPFYVFYTMWLWWSTMYFSHHYAVDLVAGSLRMLRFAKLISHLLTITQSPALPTSGPVPNSCPASSPTKSSAGTTTTSRSATRRTTRTPCSTSTRSSAPRRSPTLKSGLSARHLHIRQVAEVRRRVQDLLSTTLRVCGRATRWLVIPRPLGSIGLLS